MKKFVFRVLVFFFSIIVLDVLFGYACQYMNNHSKGGGVKSRYYVCKESHEKVLVFGSSRAKHHYVPDIIEDSLGLSCYNTGEDGNGIIFCYGVLKMITQRYKPRLIIYDVSFFDIYKDDNMKYVDLLKPYYYEAGIDSIFWSVNPKTQLMMHSSLYRFNTTCLRIIGDFFHPVSITPKGYLPLTKVMDYEPQEDNVQEQREIDCLKLQYFERFIQCASENNIRIVFCVSPLYRSSKMESSYQPIRNICKKYGLPFIFNASVPEISTEKEYFYDRTHMNDRGARLFTQIFLKEMKSFYLSEERGQYEQGLRNN